MASTCAGYGSFCETTVFTGSECAEYRITVFAGSGSGSVACARRIRSACASTNSGSSYQASGAFVRAGLQPIFARADVTRLKDPRVVVTEYCG